MKSLKLERDTKKRMKSIERGEEQEAVRLEALQEEWKTFKENRFGHTQQGSMIGSQKSQGVLLMDFMNTCQKIKSECCQAYGAASPRDWLPTTEMNPFPSDGQPLNQALESPPHSFQKAVEFVKAQS